MWSARRKLVGFGRAIWGDGRKFYVLIEGRKIEDRK
jgi:hypothetical protein